MYSKLRGLITDWLADLAVIGWRIVYWIWDHIEIMQDNRAWRRLRRLAKHKGER